MELNTIFEADINPIEVVSAILFLFPDADWRQVRSQICGPDQEEEIDVGNVRNVVTSILGTIVDKVEQKFARLPSSLFRFVDMGTQCNFSDFRSSIATDIPSTDDQSNPMSPISRLVFTASAHTPSKQQTSPTKIGTVAEPMEFPQDDCASCVGPSPDDTDAFGAAAASVTCPPPPLLAEDFYNESSFGDWDSYHSSGSSSSTAHFAPKTTPFCAAPPLNTTPVQKVWFVPVANAAPVATPPHTNINNTSTAARRMEALDDGGNSSPTASQSEIATEVTEEKAIDLLNAQLEECSAGEKAQATQRARVLQQRWVRDKRSLRSVIEEVFRSSHREELELFQSAEAIRLQLEYEKDKMLAELSAEVLYQQQNQRGVQLYQPNCPQYCLACENRKLSSEENNTDSSDSTRHVRVPSVPCLSSRWRAPGVSQSEALQEAALSMDGVVIEASSLSSASAMEPSPNSLISSVLDGGDGRPRMKSKPFRTPVGAASARGSECSAVYAGKVGMRCSPLKKKRSADTEEPGGMGDPGSIDGISTIGSAATKVGAMEKRSASVTPTKAAAVAES